jgi:hypothetical protein
MKLNTKLNTPSSSPSLNTNSPTKSLNSVKNVVKKISIPPNIIKFKNTIIVSIILVIAIYVSYIISKSYKISKILSDMSILDGYTLINSQLIKHKELKLCDFYIASAFRPYLGYNQFFNYIDLSITEKIIKNGARSIYIDIYNDSMGEFANPVISTGIAKGQWKLSLNTVPFEDLCRLLSTICFNAGYVNNFDDPFILILNLNVNGNINCLNKIRNNIYAYLRRYLLSNKYTYNKVNISQVPIKYLKKKMLIFSSDGYQYSDLEEFINLSWSKDGLKKISYEALYPDVADLSVLKIDTNNLKNYNKNNITIVTPREPLSFTNLFTTNYDPTKIWETGCQIVCMNYQKIDEYFESYIEKFKNDSFYPKPKELMGATIKPKIIPTDTPVSGEIKTGDEEGVINCPEIPSEDAAATESKINYLNELNKNLNQRIVELEEQLI